MEDRRRKKRERRYSEEEKSIWYKYMKNNSGIIKIK
jgi:hypothetical protein